jgi:hypothetical protein
LRVAQTAGVDAKGTLGAPVGRLECREWLFYTVTPPRRGCGYEGLVPGGGERRRDRLRVVCKVGHDMAHGALM